MATRLPSSKDPFPLSTGKLTQATQSPGAVSNASAFGPFPTPQHQAAFNAAMDIVSRGSGGLCIIGWPQSGRSALAARLVAALAPDRVGALWLPPATSPSDVEQALEQATRQAEQTGARRILVVADDADKLPDDTLILLDRISGMLVAGTTRLRFALVGSPALIGRLRASGCDSLLAHLSTHLQLPAPMVPSTAGRFVDLVTAPGRDRSVVLPRWEAGAGHERERPERGRMPWVMPLAAFVMAALALIVAFEGLPSFNAAKPAATSAPVRPQARLPDDAVIPPTTPSTPQVKIAPKADVDPGPQEPLAPATQPPPAVVTPGDPPARPLDAAPPPLPPPTIGDNQARLGGPGLLLVARKGDTLRRLYRSVYKGVKPPPYQDVVNANPTPVQPGAVLVFPTPPEGWGKP